jgi:hypothetical protein
LDCAAGGYECAKTSWDQGGYLTQEQRDGCIDSGMDCAGEVFPPVKWLWRLKKCWDYFTAPCGSKIDGDDWYTARSKSRAHKAETQPSSNTPSFVTAFYENTYRIIDGADALHTMFVDRYGDESWTDTPTSQIKNLRFREMDIPMDATLEQMHAALDEYRPENITKVLFDNYVERIYNTRQLENGNIVNSDNHIHSELWEEGLQILADAQDFALQNGYQTIGEQYEDEVNIFLKKLNEHSEAICATITLKIEQKVTMTREAFRGTLTVTNGNETSAMKDVKLNLEVKDADGNIATSHEFQINGESITGFQGDVDLQSGWSLGANEKGVATILFIPTKYAAPTEPVEWSFGGSLTYIDPYTELEVTRDLTPVTLMVNPSPNLDMTYFLQRDVFGDDPLTANVIEPSKDAEFALLINNTGYGDATNVNIVTSQPEIIANERNVKIDFEIVSSQLNGQEKTLALGQSVTSDFETIPAGKTAYAQWWLRCDMLGHFVNYNVEATHVTSYGNPDLSLLGEVTIHELIHSVEVTQEEGILRGFMANDIADADDRPDMLYMTNGVVLPIAATSNVKIVKKSPTEYWLTVTPSEVGWNYGNLYDPSHGLSEIKRIVRQSDGKEIPLQNFWQTDRTLRDGVSPLYEYRLHFADEFKAEAEETYVITFDAVPDILLAVKSFEGIPAEGSVVFDPLETVKVHFTKAIDPNTFTTEDLMVGIQGEAQNIDQIVISSDDNKTFSLDLSKFSETTPNGYYLLTVQTAEITDHEGFKGRTGKAVGWIFYRGGFVQLTTSSWPINSGSVNYQTIQTPNSSRRRTGTDEDNKTSYGSTVRMLADPAEGYEFVNWTVNGKVMSTDSEYDIVADCDMNVVANFRKKTYPIDVSVVGDGGIVSGNATGIYEHGTQLIVNAQPDADYKLKEWLVNGIPVPASSQELTISVDKSMTIEAVFEREYYYQAFTLPVGWTWMSTYLAESQGFGSILSRINRIVSQTDELISDPKYGMVGNLNVIEAGKAYKVQSLMTVVNTFRGHLFDVTATPLQVHKGWNWLAYPYQEQLSVASVIKNAEEGDYLVSQTGFTEYSGGNWQGSLDFFIPGSGYLYKSVSDKPLQFESSPATARIRTQKKSSSAIQGTSAVNIHRYPNTMNMTIRILQNESAVSPERYNVYAMVGNELRGISSPIGEYHYLTIYGDDPVKVSFVIESTETGESFVTTETLTFRDDVIGSRKVPFMLHFGDATGIETLNTDGQPMTVYSLEGVLISHDATLKSLKQLPKGVYIINGQKRFVK